LNFFSIRLGESESRGKASAIYAAIDGPGKPKMSHTRQGVPHPRRKTPRPARTRGYAESAFGL
jgi:hypothetical protein